ncbi:sulfite reductase flavoprotein subunit alpha [Serratia liquefaciens]|uniref:sulfite reductase flavoprotein subunit alpha n=1 Tax=Serratia liquefaciens TaxID=614 RepID=UPI0022B9B98F|nr:sulfite reductase flavoprotein subunit alpha [Serratia liquefaciens]
MADIIERILIGYGSESGKAQALATRLGGLPFLHPYAPTLQPLNEISPADLGKGDLLLIVSSSFGDGEPPANAELFFDALAHTQNLAQLRYAIFGLGDTAYPRFCGFTQSLDAGLSERGAQAIVNRVDADVNFESFFTTWSAVVEQVIAGDLQAGRDLHLRVTAYGEDNAFAAGLLERRSLSARAPYAWHLRLDIAGSGIGYRAGDTLYLLPENDEALLLRLATWLGRPEAKEALRLRELRQISKAVLRELAQLADSEDLKGMLKIRQRKALEVYLYGADLLDVLQEFCTPQSITLEDLLSLLPACLPRAYSIASASREDSLDLCVREVRYERNGRARSGTATGWLLDHPGPFRVFCRANPSFYLPPDPEIPVLFIGTGTGIAPLIGLLREMALGGEQRETALIFGEKRRDEDFLYREELESLCEGGVLNRLITAFSRDGATKYYVQHAIEEHADYVRELLLKGAHVYLCGNRQYLEHAVATALEKACRTENLCQTLIEQQRLHLELY